MAACQALREGCTERRVEREKMKTNMKAKRPWSAPGVERVVFSFFQMGEVCVRCEE